MSYVPYLVNQKCCCCHENLQNKYRKDSISRIGRTSIENTRAYFDNNDINIGDYICLRCRLRVRKNYRLPRNESQPISSSYASTNQQSNSNNQTINEFRSRARSDQSSEESDSNLEQNINQNNDSKMTTIQTAYATHKHCFICKKTNGLRSVKPESIIYAYVNYRIVIKHHSRCCDSHLDANGFINNNEFVNIRTFDRQYNQDTIKMLDLMQMTHNKIEKELVASCGVFDKFKNMASLEERICLEITGWTKEQFQLFMSYLKSVRDSAGRTKEQLVAIYRYWLSKGANQSTLAMLKTNTNQQQISHYLAQIREAINKDFVPLFLGANKGKQFYLEHNTQSVKTLHDMEDDTLAIIVDATYATLEKSSNNNFQYVTYSVQKLKNLIKPFIICCADGYFIDCYGPFQANENDATIFEYILRTDQGLKLLLTPENKIVLFLDRGFRDNYWDLVNDGFNVQIPTCAKIENEKKIKNQINVLTNNKNNEENSLHDDEEKNNNKDNAPLTTEQAGLTRLVTKVRFIVEKQNSLLKNKKALDNIRNTQAGHILIDYRICCAMCNFAMKPCIPDGCATTKIAKRIKKRSKKIQNKLNSVLKLSFTSTRTVIDAKTIKDFPKLTLWEIKDHIAFSSSFKIRRCLSYLNQIIHHSKAYLLLDKEIESHVTNTKVRNELQHSKIIAFIITSRHKRGKKSKRIKDNNVQEISLDKNDLDPKNYVKNYKVFIQYVSVDSVSAASQAKLVRENAEPYELIKRYICSCFSGRQVAGCCVHIATVIFYLSYAKDLIVQDAQYIKLPAEHLNSILVNRQTSEPPNAPRYVRHKRRKTKYIDRSERPEAISSSSGELSSDDESMLQYEVPKRKKCTKKTTNKSIEKDKSQSKTKKLPSQSTDKKKEADDAKRTYGKKKRGELCHKNETRNTQQNNAPSVNEILPAFTNHIPSLGGYFTKKNGDRIKVTNTCTIDNYLFSLWVLSKLTKNFEKLDQLEHTDALKTIIKNIDKNDWNTAREIWYTRVMKMNIRNKKELSFFGTVEDMFLQYMYIFQKHELIQKCSADCIYDGNTIISENSDLIHIAKIRNTGIKIVTDMTYKCKGCQRRITCTVRFLNNPIFLFVETRSLIKINDLPQTIEIDNRTYKLLCVIFHLKELQHFISVFELADNRYLVDNMKNTDAPLLSSNQKTNGIDIFSLFISSALYYLI